MIIYLLFIVWMWIEPSVETQFIPTIINGLASSTALTIVFTLTSVTFWLSRSQSSRRLTHESGRLVSTFAGLTLSIMFLLASYITLMNSNYNVALKEAMSSFIIAFILLLDSSLFIISEWWIAQLEKG